VSEPAIRVVIADDHALVREGIRRVLDDDPGLEVIGEASDGDETMRLVEELLPDVLLLDLTMPGPGGLSILEELAARPVRPACLVLSMHEELAYVMRAVQAGASGYLLKDDTDPTMLRRAVASVADGDSFFSPRVAGLVRGALRPSDAAGDPFDRLTPREIDVLRLVASGRSNKEIAAALEISRRTVESHREHLMDKLDIRTVAGLTRIALDHGLLNPEDPPR